MKIINDVIRNRRLFRWSLSLTVLSIAVALVGIDAGRNIVAARSIESQAVVVLDTTNAPMLTGTFQAINNSPDWQTDPHVNCNLVSYTNDNSEGTLTARYFDFATNTDHPIPGNGADSLTDVFGGRITFTEGTASSGAQVVLFDTATQTRTIIPGSWHRRSALGGNIVAFEERSTATGPNERDLGFYDLNMQDNLLVAFDGLLNKNPAVDPSGDVIVWESCQTDGTGCNITSSVRYGPGTFYLRQLTVAAENRGPDTNGEIVVYVSNVSGENDIYIQPVTGGTATQLSIPGNQRDVRVSGNLVSFESEVGNQYDAFLYDLNSGNLFRITNTPVNETLNDISVCNGVGRIVYAAPAADFDVFAFTFQPPISTVNQISDLIELVESFDLPAGTENSLVTKLQDALAAINASNTAAACDSLTAFINEAQAQSGKKLTTDQAGQLINSANRIKTGLGCQQNS